MENNDKRLERIEGKVDKLTDIVAQLSIIEERSANQQAALNRVGIRLDLYETRIETIELTNAEMRGGKTAYRWLGGIIIGLTGLLVGFFKGGGT